MVVYLNHMSTTLELHAEPEALGPLAPVLRFFRHSTSDRAANEPLWSVRCRCYDDATAAWLRTPGAEPVVIRRSSAAPFNLDALRFTRDGRWYYVNGHTAVVAPLRHGGPREPLSVHVSGGSTVQVIELIRDLILRHEEALGTLVLHAAAVALSSGESPPAVALLAAGKGGGKTTMLLHLLDRLPVRYFSGDKVFATADGDGLRLTPWRDWPHVGAGTARQFPGLARLIREETGQDVGRLPETQKVLVDPDAFEERVATPFAVEAGRLGLVLLPRYRPGPTEVTAIDDPSEKARCLAAMVERTSEATYATWQSFYVPDYARQGRQIRAWQDRVAAVPFVRVEGSLSADDALADRVLGLAGAAT